MPANQSHTVNPAALTLPDVLTELDLFAPMPDPSFLFSEPSQPELLSSGHELLRTESSLAADNIEQPRNNPREALRLEDDDLDLDLGEDPMDPQIEGSIEIPRRAATPRAFAEGITENNINMYDDDLQIDVGEDPVPNVVAEKGRKPRDELGDITMVDIDVPDIQAPEEISDIHNTSALQQNKGSAQSSASTLSSPRSSIERDLEQLDNPTHKLGIPQSNEKPKVVRDTHKPKKRKVLLADFDTMIQQSQLKAQQNDRSKILRPQTFLSRDPMLLALMAMQRNGSFVSNVLGDGRSQGWAPELRGVFSVEMIKNSGELKRKRDDGDSGLFDRVLRENSRAGSALVELGDGNGSFTADRSCLNGNSESNERLSIDGDQPIAGNDFNNLDDVGPFTSENEQHAGIESTEDLNLHSMQSTGSVALGTKHAIHLLREHLTLSPKRPANRHRQPRILFHEILPEQRTNRTDATKIFFEVLVLATKDAIKVDQAAESLGGPIFLEEKKGLWGDWAETRL